MQEKKIQSPIGYLIYADLLIILVYLIFRDKVVDTILVAFDAIYIFENPTKYSVLAWSGVLFVSCALFSYMRGPTSSTAGDVRKGLILFELMVTCAVVVSVYRSISNQTSIDPNWLKELSFGRYLFELVSTVGVAYIFADLLLRFRRLINK